ncbi:MAG: DUF523 domain-containing protein [Thalassolituus maritimus]|nr:MAG: DUF523 domain-containing protein [Thalassolituus maritimus]
MKKLLVSACLLGEPLRYDGNDNAGKASHLKSLLSQWQEEGRVIPVCPETLGGLPTPRPPAEIISATGSMVLDGDAQVATKQQVDVTDPFIRGAEETLILAKKYQCSAALLAARSPSCGNNLIYNGSFNGTLIKGDGVTTALLKRNNILCFSPDNPAPLIQWMEQD